MYDDDDDYDGRTDYDYAYGDSFNMNDPSVQLQFEKCLQTVQFDNAMKKYTQALSQPSSQQPHPSKNTMELNHANPPPSKHTTMKHTQEEPTPYMYDTLQLLFPTTHYETTTTSDYINKFPLYTAPQYITQKKHPSHNSYLYHHWNNPTETHTNQRLFVTKDDMSVTPTLATLCTLDTRFSHSTNAANDT